MLRNRCMSDATDLEPYVFPPVAGGRAVLRTEDQRWSRQGRADGLLTIGYGEGDQPVRIEYHWWRWFGRADPRAEDVYTAELWVRRPVGDWSYLLYPGPESAALVDHDRLRPVLLQALGVDIAD